MCSEISIFDHAGLIRATHKLPGRRAQQQLCSTLKQASNPLAESEAVRDTQGAQLFDKGIIVKTSYLIKSLCKRYTSVNLLLQKF
jgi:hypothetical protein